MYGSQHFGPHCFTLVKDAVVLSHQLHRTQIPKSGNGFNIVILGRNCYLQEETAFANFVVVTGLESRLCEVVYFEMESMHAVALLYCIRYSCVLILV